MEGSVLSFLKAEWKVSDAGSAHWASSIEVPVPSQESEQSCICVVGISILFLHFFYWTLELFRQCCIFCFYFLYLN
jgi:hypothetical protein